MGYPRGRTITRKTYYALPQLLTPYNPADAIYTAARMLCANGARGGSGAGIEQAVFAYNHANWYVSDVLAWAARYSAPCCRW